MRIFPEDNRVELLVSLSYQLQLKPLNYMFASNVSIGDDNTFSCVIIATSAPADGYRPLAEWKPQKGCRARIVLYENIQMEYPGRDGAEKIRNFILDAVENWNTEYVLIGENSTSIPIRIAYAMDCEVPGADENDIGTDLYYSDLDNSWDANGNNLFGEVDDDVDMGSDVYVGMGEPRIECRKITSTFRNT